MRAQTKPRLDFSPQDILDFTRYKYQKELRNIKGPQFVLWEVTHACNLRCRHCGIAAGRPGDDELNTEQAINVLDNISKSGISALMLLGGEPLVRKDIVELLSYASRQFQTLVCTNGVLLSKEYARRLRDAGQDICIAISLDGASPQSHDFIRGEGNFAKAMEGIKNCLEVGLQVSVMATISQANLAELPDMIKLAQDLGVSPFSVKEFIPCGRGERISQLALTTEQRKEMSEYLAERCQEPFPCIYFPDDPYCFLALDEEFQQSCFDLYDPEMVIGDASGISLCAVKPNGEVMPHPGIRIVIGDLKQQSLGEIWQSSSLLKQLRNRDNLGGKCGRCEYKFLCGGSRAVAYQFCGDVMAEDPRCWHEPSL